MSAPDPLDIPPFLRRTRSRRRERRHTRPQITMPPVAFVAVLRAVERGASTWPKIVKSVSRRNDFSQAQIREALKRHLDNGDIVKTGRRYSHAGKGG